MKSTCSRQSSRPLFARLAATALVPALTLVTVSTMASPPGMPTQPAAPAVKVNRTPPRVRPVRLRPSFSAEPTDKDIFKAAVAADRQACRVTASTP